MTWRRFRRWASGIQGQLVLGLLTVIVLITIANILVSSYLHGHFFARALDAGAHQRVAGLARAAAALLPGAEASAEPADALRDLAADPSVRSIAVFDPEGRARFRSAPPTGRETPPPTLPDVQDGIARKSLVTPDGEQVWRYLAPVLRPDGAPAGIVQLDLSLAALHESDDRSVAVHLLLLLVLVAAGLAVSLLAARRISAPIRDLARHAEAVSMTIPATPLPAMGAREIRKLARAMNLMLRNLRESMVRVRGSERRYRGLFDRMPDIALELDQKGTILAANAAVTSFGLRPEDIQGRPVSVLVADSDSDRVMDAVRHAVATGSLTTTSLHLHSPGDDGPRFGELRAAIHDRGGDHDGPGGPDGPRIVAILRDVTERKRADEDVAHAQRVLSVQTLASGIAHEFNNVLAMIIGTGSLLASRPDLPEEVARELKRVVDLARRGASLSAQVLGFTRRTVDQQASSDPNDVLRDTMDLLARTFDKRIEILAHGATALPRVKGSPTRLQQILLNLAINAGDAMPQGGRLTFEAQPRTVDPRDGAVRWDVEPGDYLQVTVRDTGAGMDRAVLQRVFEPYFTTKKQGEGTGLGLSVVWATVHGLGGTVRVDSVLGEGTAVHMLLPRAAEAMAEEPPAPRRRPSRERLARASGRAILIVEDEPDLRILARRVLERRGHRVFAAADGFEAEAVLRERLSGIDLVLLDINLPRRDGAATFDVLRELRPDLPVVIVSAGGVTDHRIADLLRRGARTLLRKPYEFEELEDVVLEALESARNPDGGPPDDSGNGSRTPPRPSREPA